jgi:hypothetical protein
LRFCCQVHAYIISHLKKEMPAMFGKSSKQNELIAKLPEEFAKIQKLHHLPPGDFPDLEKFRSNLKVHNMAEFPKFSPKIVGAMDEVLSVDLPRLMAAFPQGNPSLPESVRNPFADFLGPDVSPAESSRPPDYWTIDTMERQRLMTRFQSLNAVDSKVSGAIAKPMLMESGLPVADLGHIWALADRTSDGYLDADEFVVAMHLVKIRQMGVDLPDALPPSIWTRAPPPTPMDTKARMA